MLMVTQPGEVLGDLGPLLIIFLISFAIPFQPFIGTFLSNHSYYGEWNKASVSIRACMIGHVGDMGMCGACHVTPFRYVFDGKPPEMKSGELEKRADKRAEAQKDLAKAEEKGTKMVALSTTRDSSHYYR